MSSAGRRGLLAGLLLPLALALAPGGCSNDGEPPPRRCATHDQCDDDYLCGPEGTCVAATSCASDQGCCPGARCFNGWCRPTVECDAARPCEGLGTTCESGQCAPALCGPDGQCPALMRCTQGRCLAGLPCGGACGDGAACDLASGRCLPADGCAEACAAGTMRLAIPAAFDPLSCGPVACVCAALPAVAPGQPGVDGRLALVGGEPWLVSYDPRYGDLVASRFPATGRVDTTLDGVPPLPPSQVAPGYRGGESAPGPDRGRRPALATAPSEALVDLVYRDEDAGGLRYARVDGASGRALVATPIPIPGEAGRWSCVARRAGGLVGLAFVEADDAGQRSQLVRFEAVGVPSAAGDFSVTEVLSTPLPPREPAPCAGACGLTGVCVRTGGGDRCGAPPLTAGACGGCGRHGVCVAIDGAAPACEPRVYPETGADETPFGRGLFVSCAATQSGDVIAAWYDDEARALVAARFPFGPADRIVVDTGADAPVGTHAALGVVRGGASVAIAYRDEGTRALRVATAGAWPGPWARVDVDVSSPEEDLGAWPAIDWPAPGRLLVAYGDAVSGAGFIAARDGSGCWGRRAVLGGHNAYLGVAGAGEAAFVSALGYAFDADLRPRHAPVLVRVERVPGCGER